MSQAGKSRAICSIRVVDPMPADIFKSATVLTILESLLKPFHCSSFLCPLISSYYIGLDLYQGVRKV